jgi:hypothetical protein
VIRLLRLSKENYERAKDYIFRDGRELEKAMFNYYLEGGSKEAVVLALSKYQNEDGGFGHSLESDAMLEVSNCLATSVAFQIMSRIGLSSKDVMVKKGIQFLIKNYKKEFKGWLWFPPEINEVPRAMWWNFDLNEDNIYKPNPAVELTGYLVEYKELVPEELLEEAVCAAMKCLDENSGSLSMHDIFCYQRLAEFLPENERSRVLHILEQPIIREVELNKEKWTDYVARPLSFIHSPSDKLAKLFTEEQLNSNLDYIIESQNEEGYWTPNWNWGRFEEQWQKAKKEWAGKIALDNLMLLKAFGRI